MNENNTGKNIALSIVVPVFNEEEVLESFFASIQDVIKELAVRTELIFVNDGSSDRTEDILRSFVKKHKGIRVLNFSRNFGHQLAVFAGLQNALGEKAVFLDCDMQDPPDLIPEMYREIDKGYDVVAAKRESREGEGVFKKFTAFLYYRFLKIISGVEIPLDIGDFQMINSKILKVLKGVRGDNLYIRGFIPWMGFKRSVIKFERKARGAGQTKYSLKKMINLALTGVLSLSYLPLRICSVTGFIVVLFSFLYLMRVFYIHFILQSSVTGWSSLMTVILFLGGIQILFYWDTRGISG